MSRTIVEAVAILQQYSDENEDDTAAAAAVLIARITELEAVVRVAIVDDGIMREQFSDPALQRIVSEITETLDETEANRTPPPTKYGSYLEAELADAKDRIAELEAELDHALDLLGTSRGPADSVAEIARSDWYEKVFVLWRKHREADDG